MPIKAASETMVKFSTFFHIGQLRGSAGLSVGWGTSTTPFGVRLRSLPADASSRMEGCDSSRSELWSFSMMNCYDGNEILQAPQKQKLRYINEEKSCDGDLNRQGKEIGS